LLFSLFFVLSVFHGNSPYAQAQVFAKDLYMMELEDLLNMTVTSSARREQKLSETSNAMTVITSEEIERSGARQLQDLFYRVVGMQVQKVDGHQYNIGIRSQSSNLNGNLLVLVDDVICFNPGYNGTMWESIPVSLNEIERIEIIRGPGGILYSSNAVNGVINIITKSAKEKNNYIALRGGSSDYLSSSLGLGVKPIDDQNLYAQAYYQFDRDEGLNKRIGAGSSQQDNIQRHNVGLKLEYELDENNSFKVLLKQNHLEMYNVGVGKNTALYRKRVNELNNALISYDHIVNENYNFDTYFAFAGHTYSFFSTGDADVNSYNLRTQHNLSFDKHTFSLGAEWLYNTANITTAIFPNSDQTQTVASLFAQDEYKLADSWILTSGLRIDKNTAVKSKEFLLSPRVSLMYAPVDNHVFRATASRVYRATSLADIEQNVVIGSFTTAGDQNPEPERIYAFEAGYRGLFLDKKISLELDAFLSRLKDLQIIFNDTAMPGLVIYQTDNNGRLKTIGTEFSLKYLMNDKITLRTDYAFLNLTPYANYPAPAGVYSETVGASKHIAGVGFSFTQDKFKCDLYVKYLSSHDQKAQPLSVLGGGVDIETKHYFKSFLRFAYAFDVEWLDNSEAELEFVVNDIGVDHRETHLNYYVEPEFMVGLKMEF